MSGLTPENAHLLNQLCELGRLAFRWAIVAGVYVMVRIVWAAIRGEDYEPPRWW